MPRTYQELVSMKKYAVSATISSQLLPGTIHQILWTNPSSKYPQFHDSSIFIVSGDATVETNSTNTDAIGQPPLYLTLSSVPLFTSSSHVDTFTNLKNILMFPNGSALAFSADAVESKGAFLFLEKETSSSSSSPLFYPFDGPEYYFPDRPSYSVSVSQSIEPTLTHDESPSPTESLTYPTPQKTFTKTFPKTSSKTSSDESLSLSDPSPSDQSPTVPSQTQSETEHYITDGCAACFAPFFLSAILLMSANEIVLKSI